MTSSKNGNDDWTDVQGENFIYKDGTSTPPVVQQEIKNENYLSPWVRIIGFSLMGLTMALGIGYSIFVLVKWNDRAIAPTQPQFILLLFVGAVIMSSSIFTLSFDESYGWDDGQLDVACVMAPWLFFLGHTLVYLALFAKMWRVDKVLQFRRRRVKLIHVLWPLCFMLAVAVIILSLWTALDPWTWEREWHSEIPPERYGRCVSDATYKFLGPLIGVMMVTTVLAAWMAWKTRDVSGTLTESKEVFYALCWQLQAWISKLNFYHLLARWIESVSASLTHSSTKTYSRPPDSGCPRRHVDRCRLSWTSATYFYLCLEPSSHHCWS